MNSRLMMLAVSLAGMAFASTVHGAPGTVPSQGVRVRVAGVPLGSGLPSSGPVPQDADADLVADGDFHAPGVLPGQPTAASLWPRVVHVPCRRDASGSELRCAGYDVAPTRGEYIYVRPVMVAPPPAPEPPPRPKPAPPHKKPLG